MRKPKICTLAFERSTVQAIEVESPGCVRSVMGAVTGRRTREFAYPSGDTIILATPSAPIKTLRGIEGGGNWGFGYYRKGEFYDELRRGLCEAGLLR